MGNRNDCSFFIEIDRENLFLLSSPFKPQPAFGHLLASKKGSGMNLIFWRGGKYKFRVKKGSGSPD